MNNEQFTNNISVEAVTPAIAKYYLSLNTENNRKINMDKVSTYARDMSQGNWAFNGDAIRFDSSGKLIDGQHRLHGIVKSNCTIQLLIVRNLPPDTIKTIDVGKKRGIADILHMQHNITQSHTKAAITNVLLIPFDAYTVSCFKVREASHLSEKEIIDMYFANKDGIDFSCLKKGSSKKSKALSATVLSLVARAYYHEDRERLEEFIEVVTTGYGRRGEQDYAGVTLYQYLTDLKLSRQTEDRFVIFQKTQRALSYFLKKRSLKALKYYPTEYSRIQDGIFWRLKTDGPFIEKWKQSQAAKTL